MDDGIVFVVNDVDTVCRHGVVLVAVVAVESKQANVHEGHREGEGRK